MNNTWRCVAGTLAAVGLLAALAASSPAKAPTSVVLNPTPLREVEPRAVSAVSDGERFVVVSFGAASSRRGVVHDTFTGQRTSLPADCELVGSSEQTTALMGGRALVYCARSSVYKVLDLATGQSVAELPRTLDAGGMQFVDPRYGVLGRRWIRASGDCPDMPGCAALYYDHRTGETRASFYPDGPELRSQRVFYDLDAPGLPLRRVCRPSVEYDAYSRAYRPPYYVDLGYGLRRCEDGKLVVRFAQGGDAGADLTSRALAFGTTVPDGSVRPSPFVNVYELRRRRLLKWRLPPLNGRRAYGSATVTRCELFALTSRTFGDRGGGVTSVRIHRARLPAPRDPRCRA